VKKDCHCRHPQHYFTSFLSLTHTPNFFTEVLFPKSPAVLEVFLMLIPVKDRELEHPASNDFSLLQQLRQMHRGIIWKN